MTITAGELDEFLAALAADSTPVTLRRWFAKKQPKQARAA